MTTTLLASTTTSITGSVTDRPTFLVPQSVVKGWHDDPMAIHKQRWHDGAEWTEHVTHFGPVPCHSCSL